MPEFDGIRCGGLRNASGNGRVTRIIAHHILHDAAFDALAAAKGLTWDSGYLVLEYPSVAERVTADNRLELVPPYARFKAAVYQDFRLAQDDYIADAKGKCGKTRRKWTPQGLERGLAEDE